MSLIEALKSGKFIRREGDARWRDPYHHHTAIWTTDELQANDWEVQEPEVHITLSEFRSAVKQLTQDGSELYFSKRWGAAVKPLLGDESPLAVLETIIFKGASK